MQEAKKRFSAVMAFVFALCFVLSVLFVVFEAQHDCAGDDCQICQAVNTCLHLLDNTTPKPDCAAAAAPVLFALVLVMGVASACLCNENLITLKVKLSN